MINISDFFSSFNVITYDPDQYSRESVLNFFLKIRKNRPLPDNDASFIRIDFSRNYEKNYFSPESEGHPECYQVNMLEPVFEKKNIPDIPLPDVQMNTGTVKLSTPYLKTDKRWDSIGLTSSAVFLGSVLIGNGFSVQVEDIPIPFAGPVSDFFDCNVTGFTLFEDIIPEFIRFIQGSISEEAGLIAAGGPFITLNPASALYFLPAVNLLIRGEGEFIFPDILRSIEKGDLTNLSGYKGFAYQRKGLIIISRFDQINISNDLSPIRFDLGFSRKDQLEKGLDINLSRGCRNTCVFCSKVQGRQLRKLPPDNADQLFETLDLKLKEFGLETAGSRILNINDDDILQDRTYAEEIFGRLITHRFSIWGIQTSISSMFAGKNSIDRELISMIANSDVFDGRTPLLWIGTDTFLKERGVHLGKFIPEAEIFYELMSEFELKKIENYHYWISSDHLSTWELFIDELIFIAGLLINFSCFHLLPHSPFIIPYPATPLYRMILKNDHGGNIRYKNILETGDPAFDLFLVDHADTNSDSLNRLLRNEKLPGREGFFDYLKKRDIVNSLITAYSFIKSERIISESSGFSKRSEGLRRAELKIEQYITYIS